MLRAKRGKGSSTLKLQAWLITKVWVKESSKQLMRGWCRGGVGLLAATFVFPNRAQHC